MKYKVDDILQEGPPPQRMWKVTRVTANGDLHLLCLFPVNGNLHHEVFIPGFVLDQIAVTVLDEAPW